MDDPVMWAWALVAAAALASGVIVGIRLSRSYRWVDRTLAQEVTQLRRGERPAVRLDIDGIIYDLTETGRMHTSADGMLIWTYIAPVCVLQAKRLVLEVPVLPAHTGVEIAHPAD